MTSRFVMALLAAIIFVCASAAQADHRSSRRNDDGYHRRRKSGSNVDFGLSARIGNIGLSYCSGRSRSRYYADPGPVRYCREHHGGPFYVNRHPCFASRDGYDRCYSRRPIDRDRYDDRHDRRHAHDYDD